ncbi:MAG TPA: hypothetical protein VHS96_12330 [Bacteroidia bacterium]|nr:hypothetical protein [Bacteroidia bacterium]
MMSAFPDNLIGHCCELSGFFPCVLAAWKKFTPQNGPSEGKTLSLIEKIGVLMLAYADRSKSLRALCCIHFPFSCVQRPFEANFSFLVAHFSFI